MKRGSININDTFNTDRGFIIIKELLPYKCGNNKIFIAECSICSNDKELWSYGSITYMTDEFNRKKVKCSCRIPKIKYTTKQKRILVDRLATSLNLTYSYPRKGHVKLVNNLTKYSKVISIDRFIEKEGIDKLINTVPMVCGRTIDEQVNRIIAVHPSYRDINIVDKDYITFRCKVCDVDKYSILDENIFTSNLKNLLSGRTICRCSDSYQKTFKRLSMEIEEVLEHNNFSFGMFSGNSNRVIWECGNCKCENNTSAANLLKGRGCSSCNRHGFKNNKEAWLYVVKLKNKDKYFYKIGKTNNEDWKERLDIQRRKGGGELVETLLVYKTIGYTISDVENRVKASLSCFENVPRNLHPDGFSECFFIEEEDLAYMMKCIVKEVMG
ncbi:endonuclease [Vibrio phage 11895-B1]|uniref:endonuclease n=1 Tax=Vibrio phage 11895-B1 TaxID=754075 RepID=UPI0002C09C76|nr:endonuclease [Vibrio phage 11895-B1]AGH32256.1 hypothetical protein VPHG_00193 [Vibrio phage 11895-B1]